MAHAIKRHPEAFSNAPSKGRKRPREKDKDHLAWLATLPCIITGQRPVHVAHIRYGDPVYGKRETGLAEKPDDRWTVPLLASLHLGCPESQHSGAERLFWTRHGIDPLKVALALYNVTGDDEQGAIILRSIQPVKSILDRASNEPHHEEGSD